MITKTVKRYFCEHCGKGGMRKDCIERHETICFRNPARLCIVCSPHYDAPHPVDMAALKAAFDEAYVDGVRFAAGGCPACVMAAILQSRPRTPISSDDWVEFDYKKELTDYLSERNQTPKF